MLVYKLSGSVRELLRNLMYCLYKVYCQFYQLRQTLVFPMHCLIYTLVYKLYCFVHSLYTLVYKTRCLVHHLVHM